MSARCVALLGRRDDPTDAVEEYCTYLAAAMRAHNFELVLERVNWAGHGWSLALADLQRKANTWRGQWIFVQYTALAWSARGFPLRFLRVLRALRNADARIAVVYHDADAYAGKRSVDHIRRCAQLYTMRRALQRCDLAIVTVPPEKLAWLPATANHDRIVFIPVGANLPSQPRSRETRQIHQPPTIAVYGITGGNAGREETQLIIDAVKLAAQQIGPLRLKAFGRGANFREQALRDALDNYLVQVEISGVLAAEDVARQLCASEVLLFVRGTISSQRGSAIAGISCGLPVIAYSGAQTAPPITDAGVVLVARDNPREIAHAIVRVLSDNSYRESLARKSEMAYRKFFCWPAIAARYAQALMDRDRLK